MPLFKLLPCTHPESMGDWTAALYTLAHLWNVTGAFRYFFNWQWDIWRWKAGPLQAQASGL